MREQGRTRDAGLRQVGPVRVVVVGWGPVAARLVDELLPGVTAGALAVTVVGAERYDAYNRVLIAEYAVGRASRDRLDVTDASAVVAAGVGLRTGEAVVEIDRRRHRVVLEAGEAVGYDRLVLATGARATVPTLDGLESARRDPGARARPADELDHGRGPLPRGVVTLRDLPDAATVSAAMRAGQRIVVLGAGVLGMEFALAAAGQGADVVVVHPGDAPMARSLDRGAGRTLALAATRAGVTLAAHARAESVLFRAEGDAGRRFGSVMLADGGQVDGDLLLLSCGVTPRDELAATAGLAVGRGVLVDGESRTWTDPDVFAIGDCAHVAAPSSARVDGRVPGGPSGLIGPGWRQADRLAARLLAEASAGPELPPAPLEADPLPPVVMLKAEGIDVVAGGEVQFEPWDEWDACAGGHGGCVPRALSDGCDEAAGAAAGPREVTVWSDPGRHSYVKMVTRHGVLEGFASVGMPRVGAELTLLFDRRAELPADRSALLRLDVVEAGSTTASDPSALDATVCWCNGVSVGTIAEAAAGGATTVEQIGSCTRAGTGCGTCTGRIAEVLARTVVAVDS